MENSSTNTLIVFGVLGVWTLLGLTYYFKFKQKYSGDKTARLNVNSRKITICT